jgi:hypothetical protein
MTEAQVDRAIEAYGFVKQSDMGGTRYYLTTEHDGCEVLIGGEEGNTLTSMESGPVQVSFYANFEPVFAAKWPTLREALAAIHWPEPRRG